MNTPYYRHTIEFPDAAELSAVIASNGKTVLRVRSRSRETVTSDITGLHHLPIRCLPGNIVEFCGKPQVVRPVVWDTLNTMDQGEPVSVRGKPELSVRQMLSRINTALKSLGALFRITRRGKRLIPKNGKQG